VGDGGSVVSELGEVAVAPLRTGDPAREPFLGGDRSSSYVGREGEGREDGEKPTREGEAGERRRERERPRAERPRRRRPAGATGASESTQTMSRIAPVRTPGTRPAGPAIGGEPRLISMMQPSTSLGYLMSTVVAEADSEATWKYPGFTDGVCVG